ncbi:MAG: hypothetical protein PHT16_02270 [Candidatus Pacebacteria bacterium]|nr:hypothetical protein [Candidatus Paceibacterota bacterium]
MFKKLILVGFVFLFLGFKLVLATEVTPIISYTLNGTSSNIVANPVVNPVEIKFSANENIPNWVSIKIEKNDDSSIYKTFSPNSCDGTAYCTETWNGAISPKNKVLVDGIYNISVHVKKDVASPVTYDFILTSPYTITVDSSLSTPLPVSDSPSNDSNSSTNTSTTQPEPKPKVIENPTMKVKILANALAFTGQPLEIKTNVLGFSNENVVLGRASWNFGDGGSLEQINNFEKFSHTYYYSGEYVLFLEYYQNNFSKTPEATSKMVVKVLPTSVFISKVGDAKDFFIELSNNASSDIDISNWVINANGKIFIFPKNSVIMSKKQVIVPGKITGFTQNDQNNLKLYSGTGELISDYNAEIQPPKSPHQNMTSKVSTAVQPLGNSGTINLQSNVMNSSSEDNYSVPIIPIASFVFIGASAGAVYFIRRKKAVVQEGDDFDILDE